jgi:hypothetical protein
MPRFSGRASIVLLVAALAATTAHLAAPTEAHPTKPSRALVCGVERWAIKTLQDRPRVLAVKATTVAHLVAIPRDASRGAAASRTPSRCRPGPRVGLPPVQADPTPVTG